MRFGDLPERLRDKIYAREGGCWLWQGSIRNGYGLTWWDGRVMNAHRAVYSIMVGPVPEGLELDHLCEVKNCVCPAHLEPVTHAENVRRAGGMAKALAAELERRATRTHCKRGHPFDEGNTYRRSNGTRECRACRTVSMERWRRANA